MSIRANCTDRTVILKFKLAALQLVATVHQIFHSLHWFAVTDMNKWMQQTQSLRFTSLQLICCKIIILEIKIVWEAKSHDKRTSIIVLDPFQQQWSEVKPLLRGYLRSLALTSHPWGNCSPLTFPREWFQHPHLFFLRILVCCFFCWFVFFVSPQQLLLSLTHWKPDKYNHFFQHFVSMFFWTARWFIFGVHWEECLRAKLSNKDKICNRLQYVIPWPVLSRAWKHCLSLKMPTFSTSFKVS